jgi:hypothetical protein
MTNKALTGIPGLLDELLSSPAASRPARRIASKSRERMGPLPRPQLTHERPASTIRGARRGRPVGQSSPPALPRQKVTLRLPTDLIVAYRDWSWEARCQLSHLVERALADYRKSRAERR